MQRKQMATKVLERWCQLDGHYESQMAPNAGTPLFLW